MTQEDKKLLFKDLCARLPYGVVVVLDEKFGFNKGTWTLVKELLDLYCVEGMKPYLRPISSMTEEEKEEYESTFASVYDVDDYGENADSWHEEFSIRSLDWLNAHHFDYKDLIEKRLAIAVTEENNPYEIQRN